MKVGGKTDGIEIDSPLCQGPRLYRPLPSRFTYLPFLGTYLLGTVGGTALLTPAPYKHDTTRTRACITVVGLVFPLYLPYVLHLEGAKSLHRFFFSFIFHIHTQLHISCPRTAGRLKHIDD